MALDIHAAAYRFQRAASAVLSAEIVALYKRTDDPAAKVAMVELHLAKGHEHYRARRYGEALGEYRLAEGLLFSLVQPSFDPRVALGIDVLLPVDRALFTPLAETALTALRVAPDPGPSVVVGPSEHVAVSPILERYARLSGEPVVLSGGLSEGLAGAVRDGSAAVHAREFDRAVPLLERALAEAPLDQP